MGTSQSSTFIQSQFKQLYTCKSNKQSPSPPYHRNIWQSITNKQQQLQEYTIYSNSQQQSQLHKQLFQLRKNNSQLVKGYYLKQTTSKGLCSTTSSTQGRLFIQLIKLRLQDLQHVPYPDVLHLYFNALVGFRKLARKLGCWFRVNEEQIGFTQQGEVKVWLSGDYSAIQPLIMQVSQHAMVRNLLLLITQNTDLQTIPVDTPQIMGYLCGVNKTHNKNNSLPSLPSSSSSLQQLTFDSVLIRLREFVNLYNNGQIPKYMQCIRQVGVENIVKCIQSGSANKMNNNSKVSNVDGYDHKSNYLPQGQQGVNSMTQHKSATNLLANTQYNHHHNHPSASNIITSNDNTNTNIINQSHVFSYQQPNTILPQQQATIKKDHQLQPQPPQQHLAFNQFKQQQKNIYTSSNNNNFNWNHNNNNILTINNNNLSQNATNKIVQVIRSPQKHNTFNKVPSQKLIAYPSSPITYNQIIRSPLGSRLISPLGSRVLSPIVVGSQVHPTIIPQVIPTVIPQVVAHMSPPKILSPPPAKVLSPMSKQVPVYNKPQEVNMTRRPVKMYENKVVHTVINNNNVVSQLPVYINKQPIVSINNQSNVITTGVIKNSTTLVVVNNSNDDEKILNVDNNNNVVDNNLQKIGNNNNEIQLQLVSEQRIQQQVGIIIKEQINHHIVGEQIKQQQTTNQYVIEQQSVDVNGDVNSNEQKGQQQQQRQQNHQKQQQQQQQQQQERVNQPRNLPTLITPPNIIIQQPATITNKRNIAQSQQIPTYQNNITNNNINNTRQSLTMMNMSGSNIQYHNVRPYIPPIQLTRISSSQMMMNSNNNNKVIQQFVRLPVQNNTNNNNTVLQPVGYSNKNNVKVVNLVHQQQQPQQQQQQQIINTKNIIKTKHLQQQMNNHQQIDDNYDYQQQPGSPVKLLQSINFTKLTNQQQNNKQKLVIQNNNNNNQLTIVQNNQEIQHQQEYVMYHSQELQSQQQQQQLNEEQQKQLKEQKLKVQFNQQQQQQPLQQQLQNQYLLPQQQKQINQQNNQQQKVKTIKGENFSQYQDVFNSDEQLQKNQQILIQQITNNNNDNQLQQSQQQQEQQQQHLEQQQQQKQQQQQHQPQQQQEQYQYQQQQHQQQRYINESDLREGQNNNNNNNIDNNDNYNNYENSTLPPMYTPIGRYMYKQQSQLQQVNPIVESKLYQLNTQLQYHNNQQYQYQLAQNNNNINDDKPAIIIEQKYQQSRNYQSKNQQQNQQKKQQYYQKQQRYQQQQYQQVINSNRKQPSTLQSYLKQTLTNNPTHSQMAHSYNLPNNQSYELNSKYENNNNTTNRQQQEQYRPLKHNKVNGLQFYQTTTKTININSSSVSGTNNNSSSNYSYINNNNSNNYSNSNNNDIISKSGYSYFLDDFSNTKSRGYIDNNTNSRGYIILSNSRRYVDSTINNTNNEFSRKSPLINNINTKQLVNNTKQLVNNNKSFKQIDLQDGKTPQYLLQQVRKISSSNKYINTEYVSTSTNSNNNNFNYNFNSTKPLQSVSTTTNEYGVGRSYNYDSYGNSNNNRLNKTAYDDITSSTINNKYRYDDSYGLNNNYRSFDNNNSKLYKDQQQTTPDYLLPSSTTSKTNQYDTSDNNNNDYFNDNNIKQVQKNRYDLNQDNYNYGQNNTNTINKEKYQNTYNQVDKLQYRQQQQNANRQYQQQPINQEYRLGSYIYQQQDYKVDLDPQILRDIQKLNS